jgi:hypothetical protein
MPFGGRIILNLQTATKIQSKTDKKYHEYTFRHTPDLCRVMAWNKIMSTSSNVDFLFKYHFVCLKWNSVYLVPTPI